VNEFDEIYAETGDFFGKEPSGLVARFHELIPKEARILDIGVGQGRNALVLARRGCTVVGVDTSSVGLSAVRERVSAEGLSVDLRHMDILTYSPEGRAFDAVLALGIIPVLTRQDVRALFGRIEGWTSPGGLVFVTAFAVGGCRHEECLAGWECLGRNTFRRDGRIRTFLESGEILELLPGYEIVHHAEFLGAEHRHGDAPPERHNVAHLVVRKPSS
jgi:SAM-dependent methyltransferase